MALTLVGCPSLELTSAWPQYALNPDHRHDESHEKAEDEARLQIRKEHRFESFAGETEGNDVKWFVSSSGEWSSSLP